MTNGTCACNTDLNYFYDGVSNCLTCNITNCSVCSALTTCLVCNIDSFVNTAGACQLSICGNGVAEGIEHCDDGNLVSGDGCNSICAI
jgi:cysteine-rich repeat protein